MLSIGERRRTRRGYHEGDDGVSGYVCCVHVPVVSPWPSVVDEVTNAMVVLQDLMCFEEYSLDILWCIHLSTLTSGAQEAKQVAGFGFEEGVGFLAT